MRALALFLSITLIAAAEARIGETAIQFVDRYGAPKDAGSRAMDKNFPLLEGAIHHRYEFQGWKIRAAFLQLDGPAVRMDFSKLPNGQSIQIRDYELQAIASANTPCWDVMEKDHVQQSRFAWERLNQTWASVLRRRGR